MIVKQKSLLSPEYKIATSGEVFFILDNTLMSKPNKKAYEEYIKREYNIRNTFIVIETPTMKYKFNILSHDKIIKAISMINDISKKVELLEEYNQAKKEVLL